MAWPAAFSTQSVLDGVVVLLVEMCPDCPHEKAPAKGYNIDRVRDVDGEMPVRTSG
jgi:hypothetical protein